MPIENMYRVCVELHPSALLNLRTTQSCVNTLVHEIPIDLIEHFIHVVGFCYEECTLAVWCGFEQLECKASWAHFGCDPHPALAVVQHLFRLVNSIADAALRNEHRCLHLCLQSLHTNSDVLLADRAWRRALPHARVTFEALLRKLFVKELYDEL